jgi:hypothetical protein
MSEYDFRECKRCHGYGVLDSGKNCTNCGGSGTGGLHATNGSIGSGEIIIERATGRQISHAEFAKRMANKAPPNDTSPRPMQRLTDEEILNTLLQARLEPFNHMLRCARAIETALIEKNKL